METLNPLEHKLIARAETAIRRVDARLRQMGLVTMTEAAKATGIPLATLSDAIRAGAIPSVKYGKWRLVRVEAVRQYFEREDEVGDDLGEQQLLTARGLLVEIRPPGKHVFSPVKRATVAGEPVSQSIIQERR